ncbi:MAG: T9SS type A sorting domain-containing protein [Chitinophagales bacterium]|nr:T9SS type A sorting domain-containing protein [Chitinophagales bacterium]
MKKENSTLLRKLVSYSALAAPIIAGTTNANGQIVYTNVEPDAVVQKNGGNYALDLDGDSNTDFLIQIYDTISSKNHIVRQVYAIPYPGNSIAASTNGTSYVYPLAFNAGDVIDAKKDWSTFSSQYMATFVGTNPGGDLLATYGNWYNVKDKYLGLRVTAGNGLLYGWARLDVTANKDSVYFIVKDYAYQSIADSGIVAGDMGPAGVGIASVENHHARIFTFEKQVYISSPSAKGTMNIQVFNLAGQQVKALSTDKNEYQFSLADLPGGLYLVTVGQDGAMVTRKVSLR